MLMDAQNRPSYNQAITGTGTVVSTDSIDLLTANRNVGRSFPMRMVAVIPVALAGGTSIQAQIIQSANSNLSSPDVLYSGPTVALASAIAGARILDAPIPGTTKRYLGVQYVLTGTFTGSGTVTAGVVSETDNQPYITSNLG